MAILIKFLVQAQASFAESGHHSGQIPTDAIFWQIVNLTVLFSVAGYFLWPKAVAYFRNRKLNFIELAEKSKNLRERAESELVKMKHDLDKLEGERENSLKKAQADALDLKESLMREAHQQSRKLKEETRLQLLADADRLNRQIKRDMINEALKQSRNLLKKDVSDGDHKKLQNDFGRALEATTL